MKFCYVLSTKKKWKKFYVLSDCPSLYIYAYVPTVWTFVCKTFCAFVWPSPGQAWMAHIRSAWAALSSQAFWWSISIGQRGQSHRNWRCWGPHGSKRCTEVFFLTWHWMHLDNRLRLQLENIWKPEKCLRSGKIFTTKRFIALIKMAMACHSMDWSQWAPGPVLCPSNFHESSMKADISRHCFGIVGAAPCQVVQGRDAGALTR